MSKRIISFKKVTYFECGRRCHLKSECPTLQKKIKVNSQKEMKSKRAYVAWKDNVVSSSSDEEQENMESVASHHYDEEENEISDLEPSYYEFHNSLL